MPVVTRSQSKLASLKQEEVPLNNPSVGGLTMPVSPPVPLGKPSVGELVFVMVLDIPTDFGVLVKMIKYDLEGLILSSEFDKKKRQHKGKYKINDVYLAKVIRVDVLRDYYDLSFRRV
jgi:hypothetical protein